MKIKSFLAPLAAIILAAALVFGLSALLAGTAAANKTAAAEKTLSELLPSGGSFTSEQYTGEDTNITALYKSSAGYVVEATVNGYVDSIVVWVGVNNSGSVTGVSVRRLGETLGLGSRAGQNAFLEQYKGLSGTLTVGENVDALSGATVTSKAVTKAVNSAIAFVTGADISSGATEWEG